MPVKTIVLDLALPVAPKFLYDQLQRENITIEILINNAGYGAFGEFAAMPEEEILGQIHLNITTLTHLTRLFLPAMLQRHAGRIMNIASTAAFQPGPSWLSMMRPRPTCFRSPRPSPTRSAHPASP